MATNIALTGIKPTGMPHVGNFFGAIKEALELANSGKYLGYYFIADYHCLTSIHDPAIYRQNILEVAAAWLAMGLDPQKVVLYKQSAIPEIGELTWILSCTTAKGLMNRAHAYKSQVQENQEHGRDPDQGINMGLYSYPILMAADILAVESAVVPVGADQAQHIEMARDMAMAFNHYYGPILTPPKAFIRQEALVPGIDGRKMSKSYDNHIPLFLSEKKLKKIIGRIVTDSSPPDAPKNPDTSTIFHLYKFFASPRDIKELRSHYERGISWGKAKEFLFEAINSFLKEPRQRYGELMGDVTEIETILQDGARRARERTAPLLEKVKRAIGALKA